MPDTQQTSTGSVNIDSLWDEVSAKPSPASSTVATGKDGKLNIDSLADSVFSSFDIGKIQQAHQRVQQDATPEAVEELRSGLENYYKNQGVWDSISRHLPKSTKEYADSMENLTNSIDDAVGKAGLTATHAVKNLFTNPIDTLAMGGAGLVTGTVVDLPTLGANVIAGGVESGLRMAGKPEAAAALGAERAKVNSNIGKFTEGVQDSVKAFTAPKPGYSAMDWKTGLPSRQPTPEETTQTDAAAVPTEGDKAAFDVGRVFGMVRGGGSRAGSAGSAEKAVLTADEAANAAAEALGVPRPVQSTADKVKTTIVDTFAKRLAGRRGEQAVNILRNFMDEWAQKSSKYGFRTPQEAHVAQQEAIAKMRQLEGTLRGMAPESPEYWSTYREAMGWKDKLDNANEAINAVTEGLESAAFKKNVVKPVLTEPFKNLGIGAAYASLTGDPGQSLAPDAANMMIFGGIAKYEPYVRELGMNLKDWASKSLTANQTVAGSNPSTFTPLKIKDSAELEAAAQSAPGPEKADPANGTVSVAVAAGQEAPMNIPSGPQIVEMAKGSQKVEDAGEQPAKPAKEPAKGVGKPLAAAAESSVSSDPVETDTGFPLPFTGAFPKKRANYRWGTPVESNVQWATRDQLPEYNPGTTPVEKLAEGSKQVSSSRIDRIGYDPNGGYLYVKYINPVTGPKVTLENGQQVDVKFDQYILSGVTQAEYDALMSAESIGSHFTKNLKYKKPTALIQHTFEDLTGRAPEAPIGKERPSSKKATAKQAVAKESVIVPPPPATPAEPAAGKPLAAVESVARTKPLAEAPQTKPPEEPPAAAPAVKPEEPPPPTAPKAAEPIPSGSPEELLKKADEMGIKITSSERYMISNGKGAMQQAAVRMLQGKIDKAAPVEVAQTPVQEPAKTEKPLAKAKPAKKTAISTLAESERPKQEPVEEPKYANEAIGAGMEASGWKYEYPGLENGGGTNPNALTIGRSTYPTVVSPDGKVKIALDNTDIYERKGEVWVGDSSRTDPKLVVVSGITTEAGSRGQGLASKAMDELIKQADENGITIKLEPTPIKSLNGKGAKGLTQKQLVQWYKSKGFEQDREGSDLILVRRPGEPGEPGGEPHPADRYIDDLQGAMDNLELKRTAMNIAKKAFKDGLIDQKEMENLKAVNSDKDMGIEDVGGELMSYLESAKKKPAPKSKEFNPEGAVASQMAKVRGADIERLVRMQGEKLYSADISRTTGKELVQNAIDASKASGGTVIGNDWFMANDRNGGEHYAIVDRGLGMSPQVILEKFLPAGVSGKDVGEAGGLGLAKIAILGSNSKWEVSTVNKNKDGGYTHTVLKGTGESYFKFVSDPPDVELEPGKEIELAPGMTMRYDNYSKDDLDNPTTGTAIKVWTKSPSKAVNFVKDALKFVPGIDSVPVWESSVSQFEGNPESALGMRVGDESNILNKPDSWTLLHSIDLPEATIDIIAPEKAGKVTNRRSTFHGINILNRTILQHNKSFSFPEEVVLPDNLAVNIKPKVNAESADYPFSTNRENVTERIESAIKDYFNDLGSRALSEMNNRYRDAVDNAPRIKGFDSMRFLDVAQTAPKELVDEIRNDDDISVVFSDVHEIQTKILRSLKDKFYDDPRMNRASFGGIMTGGDAYGVHFGKPYSDDPSVIYHDPFLTYVKAHGEAKIMFDNGDIEKDEIPKQTYVNWINLTGGIALHEAGHQRINSEGEELARFLTFENSNTLNALMSMHGKRRKLDYDKILEKMTDYEQKLYNYRQEQKAGEFIVSQGGYQGYRLSEDGGREEGNRPSGARKQPREKEEVNPGKALSSMKP